MTLNRRSLIACGAVAASGLAARSWSALAHGDNPSNRIRIGVIGTGVRGKYLIANLPEPARVTAICDCATSRMTDTLRPTGDFKSILEHFVDKDASACKTHQDYRRLIDNEKLDAVIIATPDHHHVPAAMLALQAGLDVYLEKPLSLRIGEGRVLANAVNAGNHVLQVGSQQRTMEVNRFACEFIRNGGLGRVTRVDFPNFPGPYKQSNFPAEPIPAGLDWNLFLGQTPAKPFNKHLWDKDSFSVDSRLWRGWDLFRDYSGHLMTNWGGHNVDMVHYALGMDDSGPLRLARIDGVAEADLRRDWNEKWHDKTPPPTGSFTDERRFTPIRVVYPGGIEMNLLPGIRTATFYGAKGRMSIARNQFECDPPELIQDAPDDRAAKQWDGAGHVARPHLQNWLDCIVSRQPPNAPVEIGHRTATVCHLVNITRELNRSLHWDAKNERFTGDDEANQLR